MGWFSSDEKSVLATHPVNPDVTTKSGSGAEQDRYAQHFSSDAIKRGVDRGLDKLQNAANAAGSGAEQDRYASHLSIGDRGYRAIKEAAKYQGDGAEQDRYNAHFSPALHSFDAVKAVQAAGSVVANGEKNASWYGLGYDGRQRAKLMAGSGMGAEQERLGSHFGLSKDSVANAAQRVKDGAQDVLSRR
ncbi:hypothetical protein COCVIDRAFT_85435 [Bipolaris victoriae FI3]|uniref:Uncharacterized protein n=2 Tax=Bipolaris TaxID=33194 RepID=W6YSR9_COCC2|nr:uncharacterized protein COCCADRAFT_32404 [Bipolaris zeicola 26-R-13]XP_014561921.1 hypothetical protein COCVIDRAFT_85435 [Bipolaris victoriae FI3]EUC38464.1 hypothetical protein COCCADRAFT_32404 [Bipolaris zeicola 26-R-13]